MVAKSRILVLGGGISSLSAVYAITSQPGWDNRFEITVLQQGWRLGGKCASGRNPALRHRNEEHGLHVLGGFYHNAFDMLRRCYEEWSQTSANSIPFDTAFVKKPDYYLAEQKSGDWDFQFMSLPPNNDVPGIDPPQLTPLGMIKAVFKLFLPFIDQLPSDIVVGFAFLADSKSGNPDRHSSFGDYFQRFYAEFSELQLSDLTDELQARLADEASTMARALAAYQPKGDVQTETLLIFLELIMVLTKGMFLELVFLKGFDAINYIDARDWLKQHGGSNRLVNSTYINSGYEYAFAYIDGDPAQKDFAAGVAVRGFLRLLVTYHGSVFFHMNGGMGEIVVTPLYEVLTERKVEFRFFHLVTELELSDDKRSISRVRGRRQASPIGGPEAYEPLVEWNGRKVWPTAPKFGKLVDGDVLQQSGVDFESQWEDWSGCDEFELELGTDFDVVILGIPIGALHPICANLAQEFPRWQEALDASHTTPTIAAQLWFTKTTAELCWEGEPDPLLTNFEKPVSTWCDMSFLLGFEEPRQGNPFLHLSHLCGPLQQAGAMPARPSPNFPKDEVDRAKALYEDWVKTFIEYVLPCSGDANTGLFDPTLEPEIYLRANVDPSSLYVVSPAGSIEKRLRTDETGVTNLYLAGDWIKSGWDVGAVEAAVTAGLQCSRAITGSPQLIYGETDFP